VPNWYVSLLQYIQEPIQQARAMVASYEMIFTQPDSVTYSKTGMLFGAELVSKSTDFLFRNPDIANLSQNYLLNCVMGYIFPSHKYTLEKLMT
ncbi:conjugal transfer protein TraG, partial [Escherichia coli]|uniref:conjugal transfer protein TraG N-terminal domain-containing protein n=1 Tax=Escherichia coli TaxID=562 RepID=UPI001323B024